MIDQKSRNRLLEENKASLFFNGMFKATSDAINLKQENQTLMGEVVKQGNLITQSFDKLGKALVMVYKAIPRAINLPKVFPIIGKVEVTKSEPVEVKNLRELKDAVGAVEKQLIFLKNKQFPASFVVDNLFELKDYFDSLEKQIGRLTTAVSSMPAPKITMPEINIPRPEKVNIPTLDLKPLLNALHEVKEGLEKPSDNKLEVNMLRNISEGIGALIEKPTFVPPAVTNVNINALQGNAHSSQQTLTTGLSVIPSYGGLFNRRSLLIYNNSAVTIYIGGSDVSSSSGLPIPANSYSPVLDVGYNMLVYGLTASSTADIRVLELSNEATGR